MKLLTSGHVMTSEGGWVHRIHNVSDRFYTFSVNSKMAGCRRFSEFIKLKPLIQYKILQNQIFNKILFLIYLT